MVPGLFGFQSQALPYLIHSLIPEGSRLSAGLSPFLPLVCLLLRFVVLLLAMPSTTLPYIQPFAEFYFVLSDRLLVPGLPRGGLYWQSEDATWIAGHTLPIQAPGR